MTENSLTLYECQQIINAIEERAAAQDGEISEIKAALEAGTQIEGAKIVERESLQVK
jgi:hypothetical protein